MLWFRSMICNMSMCQRFVAVFQCSGTCTSSRKTRDVLCASLSGNILNDSECDDMEKPESEKPCELEICSYKWNTSDWSQVTFESLTAAFLAFSKSYRFQVICSDQHCTHLFVYKSLSSVPMSNFLFLHYSVT